MSNIQSMNVIQIKRVDSTLIQAVSENFKYLKQHLNNILILASSD